MVSWLLTKMERKFSRETTFSTNGAGTTGKRMKLDHCFRFCIKSNSKWIKKLKVATTTKLL